MVYIQNKNDDTTWKIYLKGKVQKSLKTLPKVVRENLLTLIREIELYGTVRGNWPKYGKLYEIVHHCHIKSGRPTYVVVWEVIDNKKKIVEVTYAGTYEKAPY
jgi:mRNA-degrading endonuclease RelE of RelBE toxin-antitoxin system